MHEVRCIVLDEIELFQALVEFYRFRHQPLPAGQVDHIVLTEDETAVTASFTIRGDHGAKTAITVAETELAAMVIRYLLERKVPLASQMQKQLIVVDDQLTLVLHDAPQPFRHGLGRHGLGRHGLGRHEPGRHEPGRHGPGRQRTAGKTPP